MHFDLADLRLFVQVAEAGNLTRGAHRAALSPAAASARIKALEGQLNTRLFYRDSRGVALTSSGSTLLRHARVILRQVEHVKTEFAPQAMETVGHIRIFANTTAVTEFMPEILARYLAERPGVTVDLQEKLTRDIVRGVLDGSSDFGIVAGPVPTAGLQAMHFSTDRLVLATPLGHALAAHDSVSLAETLDYEHVSLHEGSTLHHFLCDMVAQQGRSVAIRTQVRSFEAMCRMIEAGVGVGVIPESAAIRHRRTMQLAVVGLTDPWCVRERMVLVREFEALPGCARALIAELMAHGAR